MKFISLGFWAIAACVTLVSAASFSNPLKAVNGSDPHIVYDNGYYYLMTTTWTNLQITRARTLEGLKTGQNKVVWTDSNSARCCNVWAPEHLVDGGASPWDSFSYAGQLTRDWGIDGTVLRFPNQNYFVWSCFPRANWQSLCIAPMTSPTSIGASRVLSEPTQSWEQADRPVQEGPAALYHGSSIFLAYSASFCWTSSYQLGLLTYKGSGDPTLASSWAKSGPVFSSANGNYGIGSMIGFSRVLMARKRGMSTMRRPSARELVTVTDIPPLKEWIGPRTASQSLEGPIV